MKPWNQLALPLSAILGLAAYAELQSGAAPKTIVAGVLIIAALMFIFFGVLYIKKLNLPEKAYIQNVIALVLLLAALLVHMIM